MESIDWSAVCALLILFVLGCVPVGLFTLCLRSDK